jgi:hypothetical protein
MYQGKKVTHRMAICPEYLFYRGLVGIDSMGYSPSTRIQSRMPLLM